MTPVLSVVIPVYNAARTITRCIDSVIADLDSTPYSWELLLVDDGAEDDSLKIMQDYLSGSCHREQIRIIEQPNRGAATARNAGIRGSSGQYVAFNDSDDIWLPGKTREQMQYLLSHPEVDMICGAHEVPFKPYFKKLSRYTRITVKDIALQNFCSPPTTIIKRSILSRTGLFDETLRRGLCSMRSPTMAAVFFGTTWCQNPQYKKDDGESRVLRVIFGEWNAANSIIFANPTAKATYRWAIL